MDLWGQTWSHMGQMESLLDIYIEFFSSISWVKWPLTSRVKLKTPKPKFPTWEFHFRYLEKCLVFIKWSQRPNFISMKISKANNSKNSHGIFYLSDIPYAVCIFFSMPLSCSLKKRLRNSDSGFYLIPSFFVKIIIFSNIYHVIINITLRHFDSGRVRKIEKNDSSCQNKIKLNFPTSHFNNYFSVLVMTQSIRMSLILSVCPPLRIFQ